MNNTTYVIKKIFIIILIIIIISVVFLNIKFQKANTAIHDIKIENIDNENIEDTDTEKSIAMCFYLSNKTKNGLYDKAWLKLSIINEKITGEFYNIPAEKDSKVGTFEGTVGPVDKMSMSRRANVWWDSFAEGMKIKEELVIDFGEGNSTVGFGEMVDRGDGVYVYKDKSKLTYIDSMGQIDCLYLDEKISVEKYIKDNIKTIATNKPVLGGSWYLVSIFVNPIGHNGEIVYEDGHIQSKANFSYIYQKNPESISITKFEAN